MGQEKPKSDLLVRIFIMRRYFFENGFIVTVNEFALTLV